MDQASPIPPPGDQTVWIDASSFLSDVCDSLEVGQLVNGENFSLFEAMSALEIMDPKMDAGMTGSAANTPEEAIEKGLAPINLSVLELIDVLDHLLSCEATWHRGHSLAQTVFSCLYLLDLDRTSPNALLHAYCRTTRATCNAIRAAVYSIHSNEEEELFTLAYGLPLEGEGDAKCLSSLHLVEESVIRQLKGSKGITSKKRIPEETESLQEDPALEEQYCQALLCRIRFRKAFYHAIMNMNKPQGRGLETAHKHISVALSEMKNMELSSGFLSRCAGNELTGSQKTTASGREAIGFDARVNRRISAPTPPRSISIISWEETRKYFIKLLEDLDIICTLSTNLSLEELLQAIVDFQKCSPDLVARTFLQILVAQDGKVFGKDSTSDTLHKTFNLPESISSKVFESDSFVVKAGQFTMCLVRVLCTNISWQHRKLGKILAEWGLLLQQADTVFDNLMQNTLAPVQDKEWWENVIMGWTAQQTCWISMHLLLLGFQLQLYAPAEYCMVYWYLEHVILTELHYKQLKEKKQTTSSDAALDQVKKKKNKKKGSLKGVDEDLNPTHRMLLLQCYGDLCKALSWMMAALASDRKFNHDRPTIFNTEYERFVQRFDLFQKVPIPQPLSYFHYKEFVRQRNVSLKEQYYWASHYFMTLQQHLQELSHHLAKSPALTSISRSQRTTEINQLKQVALRNLIVLKIVHNAGPGASLKVSFNFSQHPCFAVASVEQNS